MFGAPNVGDAAFATDFNTRINARNIEYVADIVPQLPCAGHMPVCTPGAAAAAADDAADSASDDGTLSENSTAGSENENDSGSDTESEESSWDDTGSDSSKMEFVSYARLGGRLQLEAVDMPVQQDAWRQLSTYRQVSIAACGLLLREPWEAGELEGELVSIPQTVVAGLLLCKKISAATFILSTPSLQPPTPAPTCAS
jgi:hypothetical protein